jgi:hypothetical protein
MHKRAPGICVEGIYRSTPIVSIYWVGEGVQLSSGVVEAVHWDECDLTGEKLVELAQEGGAERSAGVELVRKQHDLRRDSLRLSTSWSSRNAYE